MTTPSGNTLLHIKRDVDLPVGLAGIEGHPKGYLSAVSLGVELPQQLIL